MRDKTAIVVVGPTACGVLSHILNPARNPYVLAAEACCTAVQDADRATQEVDGMSIGP